MFKQRPFPFSILVLITFLTLHFLATYYHWYWSFRWLDIVVHVLGGLWLSLLVLWVLFIFNQINSLRDYKFKSFAIAILISAAAGFLWEVYEIKAGITSVYQPGYGLDTIGDIVSGIIGSFLAYLYFTKTKKCVPVSGLSCPPDIKGGIVDYKA
ncbi:MAG: hypothetical protein WCO10_01350 [bacterium]